MRLRHKPWAKDKIDQNPQYVVANPEMQKGNWHNVFEKNQPLHIEVGTGKGQFLIGMAKANPDINYIGIELYDSVIVAALDRLIEAELPNLKLLNVNAAELDKYFAKNDVERVYLNFSDPWPKSRHEKRRLTYKNFLKLYEDILVDGGEIHFKTDNKGLFEYSLMSFSAYGLLLKYVSLDFHKSGYEGNVMTEYEQKFSERGQRIYRSEVKYQNQK
ncbi:tRNA (guanine-N7-)-methyltransferase [Bacillus sp. SORGH_AS 510]|uniref:tRNA (guanosine(46)-N7)-methyltransferase TrmB n=1 Tax=Bacillus sp. SORGH_AS_0510 TaxID=3041771 RepID=UPI00277EBF4D|nr:tRNA (guanosine(46)-N7)-methyltransferase TrmB [Bacillus sp. SORGH_AS_0510]MDQ1144704.1 tRNA (guanine-N7-)-methyltransferase [Bacillus sp. SORGH_AS_0510]